MLLIPDVDLLIMSCSAKKRLDPGLLPALERYDGVAYRVLKKAFGEVAGLQERLTVLIVSAEFGLIPATRPIPWYDRSMNAERARAMRTDVARTARAMIGDRQFGRVLITGGKHYRAALVDGIPLLAQRAGTCTCTSGGIGVQLGQLHAWLREGSAAPS